LLIESASAAGFLERARIKYRLEQILQLPVDVLTTSLDVQDSPFVSQVIPLRTRTPFGL